MRRIGFFVFFLMIQLAIFANPKFKIQNGPYLQNVGEQEATVMWTTNRLAVSWVEIAPKDGSHFYAIPRQQFFYTNFGKKMIDTLHQVHITGLEKGTTYRYRICSKEVLYQEERFVQYGRIASSEVFRQASYEFTTLDATKPSTEFWVVNDIHGHNEILSALLKDLEEKDSKADFVVFNGDMLSDIRSEEHLFNGFMNRTVDLFASHLPMFYNRGNHENRGQYSTEFMRYFPTNSGKPYYTFQQGPVFFVVIDSGEDKPDEDIAYYDLSDFDAYISQESEWLKGVVASKEFKEAQHRIVLMHMPPIGRLWHGGIQAKDKFVSILNNANVDLMLCAHLHQFKYHQKGTDGCLFPIIVNSNEEVMKVKVDSSNIKVEIVDVKGEKRHSYEF